MEDFATVRSVDENRTPDDDPERLYDDVLVSIIADKGLANRLPSGHARWLNALDLQPSDRVLHCGCGTACYTAIIAHVVRNSGHVTAIELEQSLASLAEETLRHLSHVEVIAGNGLMTLFFGEADASLSGADMKNNPMTCEGFVASLQAFRDDVAGRIRAQEQLAGCLKCSAYLRGYKRTIELAKSSASGSDDLTALTESLVRKIVAGRRRS